MTAPADTPTLSLADDVRVVEPTGTQSLALTEKGPWQAGAPVSAQGPYERRQSDRDALPPRTAKNASIQRFLNDSVRRISKSRPLQAVFALAFVGAIALLWYTANHRLLLIEGTYEAQARRGQLETELLEKNREWSEERMQALRDSVANADRRRVFLDYATLADWLRAERSVARAMELDFAYTLTTHDTSRMPNVDEVTVTIRVHVPTQHEASAYPDLMRFLREMIRTPWYVEIMDASINSDSRGARDLEARLRIWVHDKVNADD
ncbi:MAG: hypothetical protein AAGD86_03170 [Pseudomonadota bacterium]